MVSGSTDAFRSTTGIRGLRPRWKEELQKEIKDQRDMGYDGLLEEDQFLEGVNLEDLENSSGEQQEYWLLAIQAAREAQILSGATTQHVCIDTT